MLSKIKRKSNKDELQKLEEKYKSGLQLFGHDVSYWWVNIDNKREGNKEKCKVAVDLAAKEEDKIKSKCLWLINEYIYRCKLNISEVKLNKIKTTYVHYYPDSNRILCGFTKQGTFIHICVTIIFNENKVQDVEYDLIDSANWD